VENHDEHFEKYLSEFQPRQPRALPEPALDRQVWPRRLAAAAAIAIALGSSVWFAGKKSEQGGRELVAKSPAAVPQRESEPRPLSLLPLTQLAFENPAQLDVELARASRRELPDFRGSGSTLRVLAKE
jgi:hypothetical protein